MIRVIAASLIVLSARLFGQAFEVAAIKPSDPGVRVPIDLRVLPGGRLAVTGYTLKLLIHDAYGLKYNQISGGPAWTDTDRFDIAAKAEGDPSHEQMMKMLQSLLAERFQLKIHRESKEGAVYALVVAKNGPRLQAAKTGEESFLRFNRTGVVTGQNTSMSLLADRLNDFDFGRPVLDRTGLKGNFDFKFEYAPDDAKPDSGPSIFTALQELGLKLEPQRGPVEVLVIDRAAKPSGN
jgi:uncharacterized protein (TIGR03435 family)